MKVIATLAVRQVTVSFATGDAATFLVLACPPLIHPVFSDRFLPI
jgi:hypothetical protein